MAVKTFPDPYLTVVDACAQIARSRSVSEMSAYVEGLPVEIKQDERVTRAVKNRIADLRTNRRKTA